MGRWMINCKEHSRLVSENMDRPITFWSRVSVKLHEWICPACSQIQSQLEMIREACRRSDPGMTEEEYEKCQLSEEASMRLKAAINDALTKENGTA